MYNKHIDAVKSQDIAISQNEIIYENITVCPSCQRYIPVRIEKQKNFLYAVKECPFENKIFREFLFKDKDFFALNINKNSIPPYFPHIYSQKNIGDKKITENELIEYDVKNIQNISLALLYLTHKCNSNCSFCADRLKSRRYDMTIPEINKAISMFKKKPIYLFGGEPTTRKDLPLIINLIKRSNNHPYLFTNGLKLNNEKYLKQLIDNGLEYIFFSLDSLDPKIYEKIRNMPKSIFEIKNQALKNIQNENIKFSLETTLIKGLNDQKSLSDILSFVAKNNRCNLLSLRPLSLCGNNNFAEFNQTHLSSREEIYENISNLLNIEHGYFQAWDKFKLSVSKKFNRTSIIKIPVFGLSIAYFYKKDGKLVPLVSKNTLEAWTKDLNQDRYPKLGLSYFKFVLKMFRYFNINNQSEIELDKNIFRIMVTHLISPETIKFEKGDCIKSIFFYPNDMIRLGRACFATYTM